MSANNLAIETKGFEFIEFSGEKETLSNLFTNLGFSSVAQHEQYNIGLWEQDKTKLLLNNTQMGHAANFIGAHPTGGVSSVGFRVDDAQKTYETIINRGARPADNSCSVMGDSIPAIWGVGGSLICLVDDTFSYEEFFNFNTQTEQKPFLTELDHITNLVAQGGIEKWEDFYKNVFNFHVMQRLDINGQNNTGIRSTTMFDVSNKIRIPLTEGKGNPEGQIEKFITDFGGEGVQHVALATDDIYNAVKCLKEKGIEFINPPPKAYYEKIDKRIPGHSEDIKKLEELGILIDGSLDRKDGILLQIFTKSVIGPVFFEIIQRKDNEGFGEGNFEALFVALEEQNRQDALEHR